MAEINFSTAMSAWAAACSPESRRVAKLSIRSSAVCKLMSVASKRKAVKDDYSDCRHTTQMTNADAFWSVHIFDGSVENISLHSFRFYTFHPTRSPSAGISVQLLDYSVFSVHITLTSWSLLCVFCKFLFFCFFFFSVSLYRSLDHHAPQHRLCFNQHSRIQRSIEMPLVQHKT